MTIYRVSGALVRVDGAIQRDGRSCCDDLGEPCDGCGAYTPMEINVSFSGLSGCQCMGSNPDGHASAVAFNLSGPFRLDQTSDPCIWEGIVEDGVTIRFYTAADEDCTGDYWDMTFDCRVKVVRTGGGPYYGWAVDVVTIHDTESYQFRLFAGSIAWLDSNCWTERTIDNGLNSGNCSFYAAGDPAPFMGDMAYGGSCSLTPVKGWN